MSDTQAVVISGPGEVGLQAVSLKAPAADEVVVETAFTSISAGTERMLLAGQMPHPMLQFPVVPGYETVGRVVATGSDVDASWQDRWVYVGGAQCYEDVNAAWGGASARLHTAAERVIPLDEVDPRHGVLLALAATALHGIDVADLQPDQRVLTLGQGPVGQFAARLAQAHDTWTAVTDINPVRLNRATADAVINVGETDLNDGVTEPVDVIIEASGKMQALAEALPLLKRGGTILLLGYYQQLELPYMPLFLKEAKLLTAREWAPGDLARSRDLIADGVLDVGPLLTHSLPVEQIDKAYDIALNDADCIKLVVEWRTS